MDLKLNVDVEALRPLFDAFAERIHTKLRDELRKDISSTPRLLKIEEAAKMLAVSPGTVENWTVPNGDLPRVEIGASVRYDVDHIQAFEDRRKRVPDGWDAVSDANGQAAANRPRQPR